MAAAQIFEAAGRELPGLQEDLAAGRFSPLREWLRETVHKVGSLYPSADELLQVVTGAPLDPAIYLRYLNAKYRALYKLD